MPLVQKTFSDIITFSRASSATMFDSSGTLVYAPMNLLLQSEDLSTTWSLADGTVTANSWTAPTGEVTGDTYTVGTSATVPSQSVTVADSTTYTLSFYYDKTLTTAAFFRLRFGTASGSVSAWVDAANNTFGALNAQLSGGVVTDVGNNIYRVSLQIAYGASDGGSRTVAIAGVTANSGTTADTGNDLAIWGFQFNISNMQGGVTGDLSTYYPTTSAAYQGPRLDYDPATLAARGLLIEEQRTNLLLWSEDFATTWTATASPTITTNTTVAPDGTTTADTIAATATSSYVAQTVTFTGDGTKTYSIFIKAGTSGNTRIFIRDGSAAASRGQADITWAAGVPSVVVTNGSLQSLQACPNGWYRLAVIVDSVVAANTNQIRIQPDNVSGTGDVIFWGAQIENAAFSTSYIPTTTTALTRSADVASVNTLSPWFNASASTLYAEYQTTHITATQIAAAIADSVGSTNRATIGQTTTSHNAAMVDGGVVQASLTQGTASTNITKTAFAFALDDFAYSVNGSPPATDTSGTVSSAFTEMTLGRRGASTSPLTGYLRRITYYPRRLSNAELQSLTS